MSGQDKAWYGLHPLDTFDRLFDANQSVGFGDYCARLVLPRDLFESVIGPPQRIPHQNPVAAVR
jgi:hypothetical protein